ncbi:MAG TPA: hypothetical protein VGT02_00800 [Methylomirabilota bacterium]|jgi:hypothetical protein|nr:hypothetical protein [Methylomirabilota bacterium]
MSADRGRRIAVVVLVLLLSLPPLALLLPGSPATVRVAGVGVLWWYAALAAPLLGAALATVILRRASR